MDCIAPVLIAISVVSILFIGAGVMQAATKRFQNEND